MPKIFYNLQALRFLAAVSVATFHTEIFYRRAGGMWTVDPLRVGFARIDLFFVISGFVTAHVAGGMKEPKEAAIFLYRRFARIFTNYWPIMLAMIVIVAIFTPAALGGYDYLRGIFLIHVPGRERILPVTWTLTRELAFYIAFAFACLAPRRLLPWLAVAFVLLIGLNQTSYALPLRYGFLSSPMSLEFLMGIGVRLLLPRLRCNRGYVLLAVSVVTFFACAYLYRQIGIPRLRGVIVGPAAAFLVFAAANLEVNGRVVKRWLSLPGDYAYSIYLVHWPILELTGHILRPWVKANPWSAEPVHILIVAATVAYAAFHYRWVERPLYRFATSWLKKPRPATLQAAPAV